MTNDDYITKTNQLLAAIPAAVEAGKLSPKCIGEEHFEAPCGEFLISLRQWLRGRYVLTLRERDGYTEIDSRVIDVDDDKVVLAGEAFRAMRSKAMNADKAIDDLLKELDSLEQGG